MVSSHLLRKTQCSSCRSWLVTDVVAKELKSRLLCRRQNSLAGHGRQQSGSTLLILKPFSVHRPTLERVERHSRKALKKSRNPAESSGTLCQEEFGFCQPMESPSIRRTWLRTGAIPFPITILSSPRAPLVQGSDFDHRAKKLYWLC